MKTGLRMWKRVMLTLCGFLAVGIITAVFNPRPATAQATQEKRRAVLVDIEEEVRQQGNNAQAGGWFELTAETLDQWVFNGSPDAARQNYQTLIKLEISQIDAVCELSPDQKRVLELAGAGELQRIREVLAVLHARYAGRSYEQDKVGEVFQEIQPFRSQVQRQPLDPTSLLYKLLQTTLDRSQQEKFAAWTQQRQRARLRGQIDVALAAVEQQVPLRDSQRQALVQLLQAEVLPVMPDAEGFDQGVQQNTAVLAQMNAIAPQAFQALLTDVQWEAMQTVFLPYRGRLRLLQQRGLLQMPERKIILDQAEAAEVTTKRENAVEQPVDDATSPGQETSQ